MVRRDIITEDGAVARELLNSNCDESVLYDVIVVGSGMGGGVVASALADEGKKVLVLEAGSLLFPTHVGNLPRRLQIGKFQKQIWSLYDKFTVENYDNAPHSEYQGAQAFNLGGRSMFWGASIPELAQWELDAWPKSIQQYLLKDGYKLAKSTFNADTPELKAFHGIAADRIQKVLGEEWTVQPADVAVEYAGVTEWAVPSGIFSTADLLIEDAMVDGATARNGQRYPLTVNLHHQAWNLCMDGNRVDGVNCFDLLAKKQRTYRAKTVVLAAGTLESAKIALQSNLAGPLIGKGITDHPIWYRHFVIPPHSKALKGLVDLEDLEPESTKIIIRHKSATIAKHGFDIVLELGSQWNQGRFVDRDHIVDDLKARNGYMLCEIVFQFYSELEENNSVTLQGWNKPVKVSMKGCPTPLLDEARREATKILREFEAYSVVGESTPLYCNDGLVILEAAKVGGVAHEVGTLRMPYHGNKGVVDEHLKFEGTTNLFVCDNSVFPCSPAGNPSLTLVALARRCALDIVKTLHGEPLECPVPDPVVCPIDPVKEPVKEPVDTPVEPPSEIPVEPPIKAPVEPPVEPPTKAPEEPPTKAPEEPPVETPRSPVHGPIVRGPHIPIQHPKIPIAPPVEDSGSSSESESTEDRSLTDNRWSEETRTVGGWTSRHSESHSESYSYSSHTVHRETKTSGVVVSEVHEVSFEA